MSVHQAGKGGGGYFRAQVVAFGQCIKDVRDTAFPVLIGEDCVGEVGQEGKTFRSQDGFRVELDANPRAVIIAESHHFVFRASGGDGETGIGCVFRRLDDKRVVPAHFHRIGDSLEQALFIVVDVGTFTVHHIGGAADFRSGKMPQKLVSEADSEYRDVCRQSLEEFQA